MNDKLLNNDQKGFKVKSQNKKEERLKNNNYQHQSKKPQWNKNHKFNYKKNHQLQAKQLQRSVEDNLNLVSLSRQADLKISGLGGKFDYHAYWKTHQNHNPNKPTKIFALGGLEEVGKNMYCVEYDDEILIIDCGIKFASKKDLPGISGIVPSFNYLKENEHKVQGLIVTHGHEDHIGGISYLLKTIHVPNLYASVIASELIQRKVSEHKNAVLPKMNVFTDHSVFETKHFVIDFYRVNHSIPDSFGIVIATPNGNIASTGDFRFDFASHSDKTDVQKIAQIAQRKLDVLLCESTNSEHCGFGESEENVIKELHRLIMEAPGRIILTSFASNLARLEEIIKIAVGRNKKIIIIGRSMIGNIAVSRKVGYLKIDDRYMIQPNQINQYPDHEILILCTGSQGEENAALNNMARGKNAWINLKPTDTIIMSSNAIPGNYMGVQRVVNELHKSGAKIFTNSANLKIHSSGHGAQLEQQLLINFFNPTYLIPIHGEYRMLRALQNSAVQVGLKRENIPIMRNGQVVYLFNRKLSTTREMVSVGEVYIDANDSTAQGLELIQERLKLAENGVVYSKIYLDLQKKTIISLTPINVAGSFFAFESLEMLKKINSYIKNEAQKLMNSSPEITTNFIVTKCQEIISWIIWKHKKSQPVVVVEVVDLSKEQLLKEGIKIPTKTKIDLCPKEDLV